MRRMGFFQSGGASQEYEFYRDHESRSDVRDLLDAAWTAYEPYCPELNFLADAKNHFHSRTWEMLLAYVLLDRGYQLKRPPEGGPDVQISNEGKNIWLEAIAVERGNGDDRADENVSYDDGKTRMYTLDSNQTALRYTNAINEKLKQRNEHLKRRLVGADDIYLIAINGALLPNPGAQPVPEVVKAVYAFYGRDYVTKGSGAKVSTTAFQTAEYAPISGLICARSRAGEWNPETYKHWQVVHNEVACNPLPAGFFRFGQEAVVQRDQLIWTNHTPEPGSSMIGPVPGTL
jgi:hypothetical protein